MWKLLFPAVCLNCQGKQPERWGLCAACLEQVEWTGLNACIGCGRRCVDGHCAAVDHRYSRVLSLARYQGPWRAVVQAAKFARDRQLAQQLAQGLAELAGQAQLTLPRLVVPSPAAFRRWRNFELTALLARQLADWSGAWVESGLRRRSGRRPQVQLTAQQRREGLEDFIYWVGADNVQQAVVWLVDDVYTTGSTADACAGVLLAAGAKSVYVLVLGT